MADLPGINATFLDGNLNPEPPRVDLDDSIVVIGTSADGPMYEPIPITVLGDAEDTFGSLAVGNLVRNLHEAWNASEGSPNLYGMRIGTGTEAYLDLYEQSGGTGVQAPTTGRVAMRLTAKYPSGTANNVSVGYDDARNVAVYNPKTDTWSTFTWDTDEDNQTVDVHNVQELADAINADTNLNSIIEAEAFPISASFELKLLDNSSGVTVLASGAIRIQLSTTLLAGNYETLIQNPGIYTGATPVPNPPTRAGNRIHELTRVYSMSNSGLVELETSGVAEVDLDQAPFDGKLNSGFNTILAIKAWEKDEQYWNGPDGNPISEFYEKVDNQVVGPADGSTGTGTMNYSFTAYLPPDSPQATTVSNYPQAADRYINLTQASRGDRRAMNFEYSTDDGQNWTVLPTGQYYVTYTGPPTVTAGSVTSTGTLYIRPGLGTMQQRAMPTPAWGFEEGTIMRISYDSVLGTLTESNTLTACQAANSFTNYFLRGNTLIFGNTVPSDIVVRHGTFIDHQIGTDVVISDAEDGIIQFTNTTRLPGPGGSGLAPSGTYIGFEYDYLPEWCSLSTAKSTLEGGTNGTGLTNSQLYDELETAYGYLKNYPVDVVVPAGAYLDATKVSYHAVTGAAQTVNAGFHTQLSDFLVSLKSDGINETEGVMAVTPCTDTTLAGVADWVEALTEVDYGDPMRGANFMVALENGDISVTTFQPVIQDPTTGYTYSTTGESVYAGFTASRAPQDAATNQPIPNVITTTFRLSRAQNQEMLGMRYVTMRTRPGVGMVITEDVTAAAPGSDYINKSTVRIVNSAMDVVREVCEPFLGKNNTPENRNAMDTEIRKGLQAMVDPPAALEGFNFTIQSTTAMKVLKKLAIKLTLQPVMQIKEIKVTVRLSAA